MPSRQDVLATQADRLVKASHLFVIGLPEELASRFPAAATLLRTTKLDDWDFFGTVAGVGAGILQVPGVIPRSEAATAIRLASEALSDWNREGAKALQDLMHFVRRGADSGGDLETGLGAWLLWNVKGDKPTTEEWAIAPVIGRLLLKAASNCWT